MNRSRGCLEKLARMDAALHHGEADRVPVSDFFWGSFLERWKRELGLPATADIYRHYDLDWIVTVPNMDPRIRSFEVLRESAEEVVVRTGYGAVIRKIFADPMPAFLSFETDSLEKMAALRLRRPGGRQALLRRRRQPAGRRRGRLRAEPSPVDRHGEEPAPGLPRLRQHL